MSDDTTSGSHHENMRQVHARNGEVVEVPVDEEGHVVVFWLDVDAEVPDEAIRNAEGKVLNTLVKLPTGYVTVPVDADRTPLEAPVAGVDETD